MTQPQAGRSGKGGRRRGVLPSAAAAAWQGRRPRRHPLLPRAATRGAGRCRRAEAQTHRPVAPLTRATPVRRRWRQKRKGRGRPRVGERGVGWGAIKAWGGSEVGGGRGGELSDGNCSRGGGCVGRGEVGERAVTVVDGEGSGCVGGSVGVRGLGRGFLRCGSGQGGAGCVRDGTARQHSQRGGESQEAHHAGAGIVGRPGPAAARAATPPQAARLGGGHRARAAACPPPVVGPALGCRSFPVARTRSGTAGSLRPLRSGGGPGG